MSEVEEPPILAVDGVVAGYDQINVLTGLSLVAAKSKITAIIGPNGHGKTTLMRVVTGILPLRNGGVSFLGKRIDGLSPQRIRALGVAMVPQGDLLFPSMTVLENLQLGGYLITNKGELRRKLEKVYDLLPRLHERRSQRADTLSGGERRMLAIGRAFAGDCRLLIADEPSLGLAPKVVDEVYSALTKFSGEALGVLIVEENTARITDFADRVFLIDEGRVAWQGDVTEMFMADDIVSSYLGA
jgi:branched-chain amino acid transport system ATP-binding protein